ncbi:DUF3035 domain-containing protein [Sphingomonas sp. MMS24-JH45]
MRQERLRPRTSGRIRGACQAPLVIPPDFALGPPQPGAARTQGANPQALALDALFGTAPRSPSETAVIDQAGGAGAGGAASARRRATHRPM